MATENRFIGTSPGRAGWALTALLFLALGGAPGTATAQTSDPDPVATETASERDAPKVAADGSARPVLTNPVEVVSLLRGWYRSLEVGGLLGEGSVLLLLRVEPDGSVSDAQVVRRGGHHPVLNVLARRAGLRMVFSPVEGAPANGPEAGIRWFHQRISFRR